MPQLNSSVTTSGGGWKEAAAQLQCHQRRMERSTGSKKETYSTGGEGPFFGASVGATGCEQIATAISLNITDICVRASKHTKFDERQMRIPQESNTFMHSR